MKRFMITLLALVPFVASHAQVLTEVMCIEKHDTVLTFKVADIKSFSFDWMEWVEAPADTIPEVVVPEDTIPADWGLTFSFTHLVVKPAACDTLQVTAKAVDACSIGAVTDGWTATLADSMLIVASPDSVPSDYSVATVQVVATNAKLDTKTYYLTFVCLKPAADPVPDVPEIIVPEDTVPEVVPELDYELRILTFEDADAVFTPYVLDYADGWSGREITQWSDLIDNPQYYGPLMYGNDAMDAMYTWYDEGNTELYHVFPDNYAYCFWGGGHAVSNYWGAGYADEDRNAHIAKYYGQDYVDQWVGQPGADAFLGWFNVQLMTPIAPRSGNNFVVHYGYKDDYSYIENLPELSFGDEVARVIDHMYVTNTNYTLNQLYNGVKSEEGNSFGGDWGGLTDEAWLKVVAYGYDSFDADPAVDEPTSTTEFYLVKGYEVVEDWRKWDLSVLGEVAKVRFNFEYSEEMGGRYGFTIPGYFAYDDVAVRFKK